MDLSINTIEMLLEIVQGDEGRANTATQVGLSIIKTAVCNSITPLTKLKTSIN